VIVHEPSQRNAISATKSQTQHALRLLWIGSGRGDCHVATQAIAQAGSGHTHDEHCTVTIYRRLCVLFRTNLAVWARGITCMCRMDKTTHTRHTKDRSTSRVFSSCWTAQPVLVNQLFSFKNTTQTWGGVCNCKEVCQNSMYRRAGAAVCAVTQRSPFLSFPYVCPEPVLVKCSFLYINGSKSGVFRTMVVVSQSTATIWPVRSLCRRLECCVGIVPM
jgi:hypothetical protein